MRETGWIVIFFIGGLPASVGRPSASGATAPALAVLARPPRFAVVPLVAMALPEPQLGAEVGLAALEQLAQREEDRVRLGRAAGNVNVHLDDLVQRHRLLEERGHSVD